MIPPNRRFMPTPSGQLVCIDHKCSAIVDDDSVEFARKLQEVLNSYTQDGYTMQTMIPREKDQGMVVVFQRVSLLDTTETTNGERSPVVAPPAQGTRNKALIWMKQL